MKISENQMKRIQASFLRIAYSWNFSDNMEVVRLTQKSTVEMSKDLTGKMYESLFKLHPEYKAFFPEGEDFENLKCTLYEIFKDLVSKISTFLQRKISIAELEDKIESSFDSDLISQHKLVSNRKTNERVALGKDHFSSVGLALLQALEEADPLWDEQTKSAWGTFYYDMIAVMRRKIRG